MQRISPFWAGARVVSGRVDVCALAEAAGGWAALERLGRAGLLDLGVGPSVVALWLDRDAERTMGEALTLADPRYPPWLAVLPDAPPVLCVEGNVDALRRPGVGVVGTRRCTPYGMAVARHLGVALAQRGLVVVSGLARGIDGHAHRAALSAGLTVAVLGHGLSHTSPASHRALRKELVDSGGAVVSAFPDGVRPARWTFPSRNRWIAALSMAVVVVEAPERSGALITAAEAADLGRLLYAVPAGLGQPTSAGSLALLRSGAVAVHDVEELASELAAEAGVSPDVLTDAPDVPPTGATPSELAARWQLPLDQALARLAVLEVEGRVARLPGQIYVPCGARRV